MKACFNEVVRPILLPDPDGGADIEVTETMEAAIQERRNGFYLPLNTSEINVGIQFSNMGDYLIGSDAFNAKNWPIKAYDEAMPEVPADIHHAAVMTQMLTGYSAIFMTQKNFMESSFRSNVGNEDGVYGYYQLSRVAAEEGIGALMNLPTKDLIIELIPEFEHFTDKTGEGLFAQDPLLKQETLDYLREHPLASSLMAAGYNIRYSKQFQDNPDIELRAAHGYLLHYLGPGNFKNFVEAHAEDPNGIAFEALNDGADSPVLKHAANRAIFFSKDENGDEVPRTLQGIVDFLSDEKLLQDHPIYTDYSKIFECLEILTGEAAVARQTEVANNPNNVVTQQVPVTQLTN